MASSKESGFFRINQLMLQMIEAVENGDKERLVKLSQHFEEDAQDFLGLLLVEADITDEDFQNFLPDNTEELLKEASSAYDIQHAQVKE